MNLFFCSLVLAMWAGAAGAAEASNAENLLVIRDADLAKKFTANWKAHRQHSEIYPGK